MTKDIIRRYIWLVDTIYQSGEDGISFEEINKKWKRSALSEGNAYPIKTFHNHRRDIESIFNILIECRKSTNSYYLYDPEELKNSSLTTSWLIDTLAVNNLIADCQQLKNRISFEYVPSGNQYLSRILKAMQENHCIDMDYLPFWHEQSCAYKNLQPYAVKLFKQRWYLIAFNHFINEIRTFCLDRIQALNITDQPFILPDDFDVKSYFHAYFGIITDPELKTAIVKIRINENQRKYVRSLPLHHSQQEIETTENYSVFSYTLKPSYDFIQEILRFGNTMEVIEPIDLRNEIKTKLQQTIALYKKN